jgi:hypothetical protein
MMVPKFRTEPLPIEDVQNGMKLAVRINQSQARLFTVESKGIESVPPDPTLFVIKSGPLEDNNYEPFVIKQPAGTLLNRVIDVYDDDM